MKSSGFLNCIETYVVCALFDIVVVADIAFDAKRVA